MKCRSGWAVCALVLLLLAVPAFAGNGAPSGPHYNLNIIGVDNPKTADMTGSDGHTSRPPRPATRGRASRCAGPSPASTTGTSTRS